MKIFVFPVSQHPRCPVDILGQMSLSRQIRGLKILRIQSGDMDLRHVNTE